MVLQPTVSVYVGGSNPGRPTTVAVSTTAGRPGFEPPTHKPAAGCITMRPLFVLTISSPHCLKPCEHELLTPPTPPPKK